MPAGDVRLSRLLPLFPEIEEVEEVRLAVLAAAGPAADGDRAVPREATRDAILATGEAQAARVRALFDGYRALFDALWAGDRARAVAELTRLGDAEHARHQLARARAFHEAALRASTSVSDRAVHTASLLRLARVAADGGDVARALLHASRAADLARAAGDAAAEADARRLMGDALAAQRRWERAAEAYSAARALAPEHASAVTVREALARLEAGTLDEAEVALASHPADAAGRTDVRRARALLRFHRGRVPQAVADLAAAAADATPAERAELALDAAALLRGAGDLSGAREKVGDAEAAIVAARAPYLFGYLELERGRIARAAGEGDADARLQCALDVARGHGHPLLEARGQEERGGLRADAGQVDEARDAFAAAREIYVDMGLDTDAARVAEAIRRLTGPPPKRGRGRPRKS